MEMKRVYCYCLNLFGVINVLGLIFILNVVSIKGINNEEILLVYGPGLNPVKIEMPARYFFITVINTNANNYNAELTNRITVKITGKTSTNRECRIWLNTLDRKDGSYIVRYKVFESCLNVVINVQYDGKHVAQSPYTTKGVVQPDDCNCPSHDFDRWLETYGCKESYDQIHSDLKPYPSVDFNDFHKQAAEKFNNSPSMSICNYVIYNNEIHRRCYGQHVGFKIFMDAILLSLTRKVRLPDLELFVNLGDWPLVKKHENAPLPLFSWCGSDHTLDIVLPTYDLTESSLECMGRVSLDMLSVQGNVDLQWSERQEKAFWRGRDSSRERLNLVDIARKHPDIFNVSLTNFFFFRDEEHKYGPKEKHISFFKFFDYKYQINMDGTVAAYRFPYLLAGGSLVFKQDSVYYEHFYSNLKPWEHYVPFKRDLSDLVDRIHWAINNDGEAQKIAQNGRKFAESNLLPQDVICYHAVLFKEWSKRIVNKIKVREGMEAVPQIDNKGCICEFESGGFKDEL